MDANCKYQNETALSGYFRTKCNGTKCNEVYSPVSKIIKYMLNNKNFIKYE